MDFKLVFLSVACFVFFIQPAQSGVIIPAAINIGSILTTGLGIKLRTLAQASAAVKEGGANGLIAVGDSMRKLGDVIVGDKLEGTSATNSASPTVSRNTRILVEGPVVQEVVENVKEALEVPVQSIPIRSVQLRVRQPETIAEASARLPPVFSLLKNTARSKINGIASIFNSGGSRTVGGPVVYEIVETPRVYQGPVVEAFLNRNYST